MKYKAKTECGLELWFVETGEQAEGIQNAIQGVRFYDKDGIECTPKDIESHRKSQRLGLLCLALLGLLTAITGAIEIITQ